MRDERDESQVALEAVGRLAGGVAHDLNNLITVIHGYARRVLARVDGESRADLEEVVGAAERAGVLAEQLLGLSRRALVEPTVVDLASLVQGAEPELQGRLDRPALVFASEPDLRRLLETLVARAREESDQDAAIEVSVTTADLAGAEALDRNLLPGRYGVLAVAFRGTGTTVQDELGDIVVRTILDQAGGSYERVDGREGWAELRVYLPDAAGAGAGRRGLRILVTEDEAPLRRLLRELLEDEGHVVLEASDGAAALELVRNGEQSIDLLLTDVVMPDVSGIELAASLLPLLPGLQVVYMSGYTGLEEDPVPVLRKPFTAETLIATIDRLAFD